jgi:hypothetical protein
MEREINRRGLVGSNGLAAHVDGLSWRARVTLAAGQVEVGGGGLPALERPPAGWLGGFLLFVRAVSCLVWWRPLAAHSLAGPRPSHSTEAAHTSLKKEKKTANTGGGVGWG